MLVEDKVSQVIRRITEIRKEKGFTLENMAEDLQISLAAYNKIEKGETKLTLERLFQIQIALGVSSNEILSLKMEQIYNQNFKDNSVFHQEIQNLYQDNKELVQTLVDSMKSEIDFLRNELKK